MDGWIDTNQLLFIKHYVTSKGTSKHLVIVREKKNNRSLQSSMKPQWAGKTSELQRKHHTPNLQCSHYDLPTQQSCILRAKDSRRVIQINELLITGFFENSSPSSLAPKKKARYKCSPFTMLSHPGFNVT